MGIENNDFTHNEREIGYFKTPEMCIAAVREQCPNAAIANYHKDALDMYRNNESVFGECWCQAFDMHDITLEPRHNDGWHAFSMNTLTELVARTTAAGMATRCTQASSPRSITEQCTIPLSVHGSRTTTSPTTKGK